MYSYKYITLVAGAARLDGRDVNPEAEVILGVAPFNPLEGPVVRGSELADIGRVGVAEAGLTIAVRAKELALGELATTKMVPMGNSLVFS